MSNREYECFWCGAYYMGERPAICACGNTALIRFDDEQAMKFYEKLEDR